MTSAAVIIVAFGTPSLDLRWVPPSSPVVIVTNDGKRPSLVPDRPVSWLDPGANIGFGAAVNLAASTVEVDRLILANPDCELLPTHWTDLADADDDDVVTVPLRSPALGPTTVSSRYPSPLRHLLGAWRIRDALRRVIRLAPSGHGSVSAATAHPLRSHWVSGAVLSVSRDRFEAVGGFDESYFLYYEDMDLCRRLAQRFPQMRAVVADTSYGLHEVGGSSTVHVSNIRRAAASRYAASQHGWPWRAIELAMPRGADAPRRQVDVVIVHLGRRQGFGERRRARTWSEIARAAGLASEELHLRSREHRPSIADIGRSIPPLLRGNLVPEALTWSSGAVRRRLDALQPRTVVVMTSRAFHPALAARGRRIVLDYVDPLSVSYSDRRQIVGRWRPRGLLFGLLALANARFEARSHHADLVTTAGQQDSELLAAIHLPNLVQAASEPTSSPALSPSDVLFVGSLSYPPNIAAVQELAEVDRQLQQVRPGSTIRVAGAAPVRAVTEIAKENHWDLIADFDEEAPLYAATALAVAPILFASGMQNKIIDAFSHGVVTIAYAQAAAGFPSDAPIIVVEDAAEMATQVAALLADPLARQELGEQCRSWAMTSLDPDRWTHLLVGA